MKSFLSRRIVLFFICFSLFSLGCENSEIAELRKKAEKGDGWSQYKLGGEYRDGGRLQKDEKEAAKWYRKAAENGIGEAQIGMGWMYKTGTGVPQNFEEAYYWFYLAEVKLKSSSSLNKEAAQTTLNLIKTSLQETSELLKPLQINDAKKKAETWKPGKTN